MSEIPASSPLIPSETTSRLMRMATYASVTVASILIVTKIGAWLLTDSVSLLSSLVDSILDVGASIVSLIAVRSALQPADREHRFGHGKAEPLAGLAQAAFIAGSGVFLLFEALDRLIHPQPVEHGLIGVGVMLFATVMTLLLVAFQFYVIRRTDSLAVKADSLHYRADILINGTVILSLLLSTYLGWSFADPILAMVIVFYLAWGSTEILKQSIDNLMDREFPEGDRRRIREIALAHPEVIDVHDIRTRSAGPSSFIQMHLELARDLSLLKAHEISDAVMYEVEEAFPNTEVLIHQDPEGIEERRDDV